MRIVTTVFFLIASSLMYADASTAYMVGGSNSNIYRVDLTNGSFSTITSIPGAGLTDSALADSTTAYVVGGSSDLLYRVNLMNGSFSTVTPSPLSGELHGIGLTNSTAYVVSHLDNYVYSIDLANGSFSKVTPSPISGAGLFGIALEMSVDTPKIAYVIGGTDGNVYRVDLTSGGFSKVTPSPLTGVDLTDDITLLNNTTAYVTNYINDNVYRVDLTNGSFSKVTTIAGANPSDLALASSETAYVTGYTDNNVYRVNLTNGSFFKVTPSAIAGASLAGISLVLQIPLTGLSGNGLRFANYLNANAPQTTLPLLALQSDIGGALEIAAPTRNAIFTFAAQTTQLAFGQQVYDHLAQKRWRKAWQSSSMQTNPTMIAQAPLNQNCFFTDASDSMNPSSENLPESALSKDEGKTSEGICKKESQYSPWLGVFGEYTNEESQHQTPSFETGTGGFVLATDYHRIDIHPELLLGVGVAYAYTHVHEADGAGHANINQGALMVYGTWVESKWYVNWALWGGGYHANNVREVNLPGVIGGSAISNTNGWQFTPHFEAGYDYEDNWFCIEPFDMIDWVVCREGGFQEHGAGSLNMGQKGRCCSLLRNELGVRFNETLTYDWGTITFREKGSYVYQKAFHTGEIRAFLIGSVGSFVVSTLTGAQNLGVVEFESLFVPSNKKYPYGTISYQGEFGSRYQSHQGMITIGMDF